MTDEIKTRIGFAIGAGMVPGLVALAGLRIITGEWGLGLLAGVLVWVIVAAIFWSKHRNAQQGRSRRRR